MATGRLSNVFGSVGTKDVAVDLGTANTVVYVAGHGIVLMEPSVVAMNTDTGRPIALGVEAKRMMGRTPANINVIRPLANGVITDFDACEKMLRYFIEKAVGGGRGRKMSRPRMVICIPSGISGVEHRAVRDAAEYAGAREVVIIEEPMAAAIGAGLPVHDPTGNMILDIGGGTSEVAVISLGGIVASHSAKVGGDEMDNSIVAYAKKEYGLALGLRTAEEIKIRLGSACRLEEEFEAEIRGRDLDSGLPKTIVTTTEEIREALSEPVSTIIDTVKLTLDQTPPELAGDLMDRGITIVGGGSQLTGLDHRLSVETGMPVRTVPNPMHAVVIGSGHYLEAHESVRSLYAAHKAG